jgi:hypothetical protein
MPVRCGQADGSVLAMTPPLTVNWRHAAASVDSRFLPDGSVTWNT